MNVKGKHLLVIRLSALGDVAMTIPVIYSLARTYPDLKISVVTREFFGRLFINRPANVHIVAADTKGRHSGIKGLLRLINELKQLNPDMVADFHDSLRSRAIDMAMKASGKPVAMVDKDRRNRRKLTHRGSNPPMQQTPYIERYMTVLHRLGLKPDLDFKGLFNTQKQTDCIGIAPFARYTTKTYPPELMEKVAAHFAAKGMKVYLFGSKGAEADILKSWETAHPGCIALPGKLTLEKELELMASLPVMVTMDSANMHMSSLAGTKVISVWGSTTP
ncbi:MAG: glycosyltransferase family 9 protein, partial [Muribaculaceae bacterium]|nr:glycosyltransferase family 9 protein [Muribaculaceae bacterium]